MLVARYATLAPHSPDQTQAARLENLIQCITPNEKAVVPSSVTVPDYVPRYAAAGGIMEIPLREGDPEAKRLCDLTCGHVSAVRTHRAGVVALPPKVANG